MFSHNINIVIVLTYLVHPPLECLPVAVRHMHRVRIVGTSLGVLSQISLRVFGQSLVPLIEATIEDWSTVKDGKEREIMKRHNRHGSFIFYGLLVYWSYAPFKHLKTIPFIVKFVLKNQRENCEIIHDEIWSNLLPTLTFIAWIFSMFTKTSNKILLWSFAMHLSGQLKILKEQFQDFQQIKDKTVSRKEFRRLVDRHNQLLDLCSHLETSFTVFVSIQVVTMQCTICLITYNLSSGVVGFFSMNMLYGIATIVLIATMLYTFFEAGDYLTECCEEIGDVFTQCNWYNLSKESRINFSIVIARCRMPKVLTTVKMYKLNRSNLKFLFNSIYSYMTCTMAMAPALNKV